MSQKAAGQSDAYNAKRRERWAQDPVHRAKGHARSRANYQAHRRERSQRARSYRQANKDKESARARAYYQAHKQESTSGVAPITMRTNTKARFEARGGGTEYHRRNTTRCWPSKAVRVRSAGSARRESSESIIAISPARSAACCATPAISHWEP